MQTLPVILITAASAQILCQLFKVVFYSIKERRLSLQYLASAGGIPSSHSAFVTSLAVAAGLQNGFVSDIFAVCFVFGAIVIYDSYRLRGAVQKHAKLLNRLTAAHFPKEHENLPEMLGHTLPEIAAGIFAGGIFSWAIMGLFGNLGFPNNFR
jgi:acid phosphatase family membrane protein YuiD